ncbi:MAG TPA: serine hydrolase domain-containing protein [Anaerolineales bacterium]|nr:serine hydrolase domain-containing protein [Anaerolineales bacterium]HLO30956.1 serine hydrolase domain-containing protein [Anaerolineales bacterium]
MNTSPESNGFSPERLNRITSFLQGYVERGELPGMIATVSHQAQTVYYEKFGWMDCEAHKPMRDDAIFMIASMTKPITSVAIMMLYEAGCFQLDTPIAKFIPAFKDAKVLVRETGSGLELAPLQQDITFRHLFTHTSGLSYGDNAQDPVDRLYRAANQRLTEAKIPMTNRRLVHELSKLPLAFQPGTKWRYGLSIDVLGYLIEVISDLPLEVFLEECLFKPLGMRDTRFFIPPDQADRLAVMYSHPKPGLGLQRTEQFKPPFEPPTWSSGGGGLTSTARDYARFAQMLTNGGELEGVRILSPKTVALYSLNQTPEEALPYGFEANDLYQRGYGYSLGARVLMDVARSGVAGSVGEFGWDGAFCTYFWVDPKESLYGLLMLQYSPNGYDSIHQLHQQFKQLTYQALEERS